MNSKTTFTKSGQARKLEVLYADCRHWESAFNFMSDEITFIESLLKSYVFEPNTPNLFERLQNYLGGLKKAKIKKNKIMQHISKHEGHLGGILECTDEICDLSFYQKHDIIKAETAGCLDDFQILKSEIFNYASSILKKRKPKNS